MNISFLRFFLRVVLVEKGASKGRSNKPNWAVSEPQSVVWCASQNRALSVRSWWLILLQIRWFPELFFCWKTNWLNYRLITETSFYFVTVWLRRICEEVQSAEFHFRKTPSVLICPLKSTGSKVITSIKVRNWNVTDLELHLVMTLSDVDLWIPGLQGKKIQTKIFFASRSTN